MPAPQDLLKKYIIIRFRKLGGSKPRLYKLAPDRGVEEWRLKLPYPLLVRAPSGHRLCRRGFNRRLIEEIY